MEHWFSYSLSDFLLFAPETYFRLFERYNEAVWPAQILALAVGVGMLWLAWRRQGMRLMALLFAAAWLLVAWAYFWERYQTINWAAAYFAAAAVVQAALLLFLALRPPGYSQRAHRSGFLLMAFAILLQPLIGPLTGLSWQGIQLFGLTPGPTAVATVGFSLLVSGLRRWLIFPLALVWCAIDATTAWGLDWPAGLLAPAVAVAFLLLGYPLQASRRTAAH